MNLMHVLLGVAAVATIATASAGCGPTTPPTPPAGLATSDPAWTEPMVVDGSSYSRDVPDHIQQWSVYCVNPGAPDLEHASAWREVQVSENGPDGPDGNWNQGRPCPAGPVLAAS